MLKRFRVSLQKSFQSFKTKYRVFSRILCIKIQYNKMEPEATTIVRDSSASIEERIQKLERHIYICMQFAMVEIGQFNFAVN